MSIPMMWLLGCVSVEAPSLHVDSPPVAEPPEVDTDTDTDTGAEPGPVMMAWDETREYATLVEALELAPAGATIWLREGEHPGPVRRSGGWPITVRGETGNRSEVVLNVFNDIFIRLTGVDSLITFRDLTIEVSGARFGDSGSGSAMSIGSLGGRTVIENCEIRAVSGEVRDLISMSEGSILQIENSSFVGGRTALTSFESFRPSVIYVRNSEFIGDELLGVTHSYISIMSRFLHAPSIIRIEDSEIYNVNSSTGAISLSGMGVDLSIRRTHFHDISSDDGSRLVNRGAALNVNLSGTEVGAAHADVLIEDSVFEDNVSQVGGAAIDTNWLGAWSLEGSPSTATITIRRSTFARNTSLDDPDYSGAIYAVPGTTLTFENVDFGTGADANAPNDIAIGRWLDTSWGSGFSDVITVE
jgi:hypothetical protein